ncbi:MAG: sigma-70 family RNA polymerase sigma factor [Pseudomonadota bacterium]
MEGNLHEGAAGVLDVDRGLIECIAQAAQGKQAGLEGLYEATVNRVYGLALRMLQSHACAEEVVTDVYMQVWRLAASFDPARARPLTWLLMLCRSRALDQLRARDPAVPHPDPDQLRSDERVEGADPQDILCASQTSARVHAALAGLDARERQLLSLAFFKGMSHAEIAQHVDLPLGTVKTALRRALMGLRSADYA